MAKSRKLKASNAFVWVLLGLLILGLAGFGVGDFGGSVRAVGTVGDEEVSVDEYARGLSNRLREFQAQTGQSFTMSQARALGLDRIVLQEMLETAAVDNETRRIGLSVGDEEVRRQLFAVPAFQGPDGAFDQTAYEFALEQANITPAEFDGELRDEGARLLLQRAVAGGVAAGVTYSDTILAYVAEGRDFRWARVGPEMLEGETPAPTEAELTAYYDDNPDAFTAPELRKITYAWLTPDMLLDTVEVDEASLRALYEERAEQYNRPARRLVERLVFASTEDAAAALVAIEDGTQSFTDLIEARGLSLDDVDMGEVTADELSDEAAELLFGTIAPGVVGPVQSKLGPALFRVNAILAAQVTPFETAEAELRDEFAADRARRVVSNSIEPIDDLLAGGASLEEVADETDMQLGQIDFTEANDSGIAGYDAFRLEADLVQEGDFPELHDLSDGGIFALRLDEVVAPTLRPFEEVREAVLTGWTAAETQARLEDHAAALMTRLDAGETFDALGLSPADESDMRRDGFIDETPVELLETVFALDEDGTAVISGDGAVFLVQLTGVTPADLADEELGAMRGALTAQQQAGIAEDLFALFSAKLQLDAGITLNQAALNAVHTQFP